MRTKLPIALVLFSVALSIQGQDLKAVTRHYKPNDTLRYRVEFDGDPKFDSVSIGFYFKGNPAPDQPGLTTYFAIAHLVMVKPGAFDVDGVIPLTPANGTFEVRRVVAGIGPASKEYDATGLHITILVDNDAKYSFPPLKAITPR
jgi:hypothetical protein